MAGMAEIAIGIAAELGGTRSPEPLPVNLDGQSPVDAALLLRSIIRECSDAGISIHKVVVPAEVLQLMRQTDEAARSYLGVPLVEAPLGVVEFWLYRHS